MAFWRSPLAWRHTELVARRMRAIGLPCVAMLTVSLGAVPGEDDAVDHGGDLRRSPLAAQGVGRSGLWFGGQGAGLPRSGKAERGEPGLSLAAEGMACWTPEEPRPGHRGPSAVWAPTRRWDGGRRPRGQAGCGELDPWGDGVTIVPRHRVEPGQNGRCVPGALRRRARARPIQR